MAPTMTAAPAVHALAGILSYHAHAYSDPALTRTQAKAVRQRIAQRFVVQLKVSSSRVNCNASK